MSNIKIGSKEHKRASLSMLIGSIVTFSSMFGPQPLIKTFADQYGISASAASCCISLTTFALGLGLVFIAIPSNRYGRKVVMGVSLLLTSILSILSACFHNFYFFLAARFIEGFSIAGYPSIAITYLNEEFSGDSIGSVIGAYVGGNAIGGLLGRVVIGSLGDLFSWHVALITLGVINLVLSIWFWKLLPESHNFEVKEHMSIKHWAYNILGCFRNEKLICIYGIGFLLMGVYVALLDYIGYPLTKAPYNMSQTVLGFIFVVNLIGTFSSVWFWKLTDKICRSNVQLLAVVCLSLGAFLTLLPNLIFKILGLTIFVFGYFGGQAVASSWIGLLSPTKYKAQASSFYMMFYYIGSSIVAYTGGYFLQSWDWVGFISYLLILLAITVFVIVRTEPIHKYQLIPLRVNSNK